MKNSVENLEATKVKISAEVPFEEFKPYLDKAYKELASQVKIPGFRPGKAPARILDQRIGRPAVMEQAINDALPNLYGQLVRETEINPIARPEIEVETTPNMTGELSGELKFNVTVEVHPQFDLPELSSITIEVDSAEVNDDDVQKELDELRSRFATFKTVKRAIKTGDFVTLDLKAEIEGKEIDQVSQVSYEVGVGNMLEGMDEALEGMKAGETKVFQSKLAGGEHAGEQADVTITPTAVKEKELPEVDEEFAQMVSEFDTVEELKTSLREQVLEAKQAEQAVEARDKLYDAIIEKVDFPLPVSPIEEAVARVKENGGDEERVEMVRESTQNSLRRSILLEKLASSKDINVSQQELMEFIMHTAQTYGMDPSMFLQMAEQRQQLPMFIQEIAHNKALAKSLGDVTVKDSKGEVVDLTKFLQDDVAQDQSESGDEE